MGSSALGRKSRTKGARGERELAKAIKDQLGIEAHRGRQFCGAPDAPDVKLSLPGLHLESKRTEKLSIYPALEQAERDSGPDEVPLVAHRRNLKEWVVCLYLRDVLRFVKTLLPLIEEHDRG